MESPCLPHQRGVPTHDMAATLLSLETRTVLKRVPVNRANTTTASGSTSWQQGLQLQQE